eukprot:gene7604-9869_t
MSEEASFLEVIYGSGETAYLNLNCQICHLYDQLARLCAISSDNKVELATPEGKFIHLTNHQSSTQQAVSLLTNRTVMVPVVLTKEPEIEVISTPAPSRPSSTRSNSARSRKKDEEDGVFVIGEIRYRMVPFLDSEVLFTRFPNFEMQLSGKGGSGNKRTTSRRLSRQSSMLKSRSRSGAGITPA